MGGLLNAANRPECIISLGVGGDRRQVRLSRHCRSCLAARRVRLAVLADTRRLQLRARRRCLQHRQHRQQPPVACRRGLLPPPHAASRCCTPPLTLPLGSTPSTMHWHHAPCSRLHAPCPMQAPRRLLCLAARSRVIGRCLSPHARASREPARRDSTATRAARVAATRAAAAPGHSATNASFPARASPELRDALR